LWEEGGENCGIALTLKVGWTAYDDGKWRKGEKTLTEQELDLNDCMKRIIRETIN
jgi:hypothetical protein